MQDVLQAVQSPAPDFVATAEDSGWVNDSTEATTLDDAAVWCAARLEENDGQLLTAILLSGGEVWSCYLARDNRGRLWTSCRDMTGVLVWERAWHVERECGLSPAGVNVVRPTFAPDRHVGVSLGVSLGTQTKGKRDASC